jgi:hypothetical protein
LGDLMRGPPRRVTDRVIDAEMRLGVLFVGLVMAAATLLTIDLKLPGGLIAGTGGLAEARTAGFTVLVLAQLFNCFNSRSERVSALRDASANPWLWLAIAVSLVLQVLVVQLPFLNDVFGTTPLSAGDWALCVAMGSSARNRYVDLVREVSIAAVELGHWLMAVLGYRDGEFTGQNLLEIEPGLQILTRLFQVLPLFFIVGGFSNAASWSSARSRGTSYADCLRARSARPFRPALWFVAFGRSSRSARWRSGCFPRGSRGWVVKRGRAAALVPVGVRAGHGRDPARAPIGLAMALAGVALAAAGTGILATQAFPVPNEALAWPSLGVACVVAWGGAATRGPDRSSPDRSVMVRDPDEKEITPGAFAFGLRSLRTDRPPGARSGGGGGRGHSGAGPPSWRAGAGRASAGSSPQPRRRGGRRRSASPTRPGGGASPRAA